MNDYFNDTTNISNNIDYDQSQNQMNMSNYNNMSMMNMNNNYANMSMMNNSINMNMPWTRIIKIKKILSNSVIIYYMYVAC